MLGYNDARRAAVDFIRLLKHTARWPRLLRKSLVSETGPFCAKRFENGELHIEIRTSVTREHCLVLGSIAPPDGQMLSALLLAHTLKKEGALRVSAIFPYLAYAGDDKDKPGEARRPHGPAPVHSLSPAEIFAEALTTLELRGATIVAPDNGAIGRCQAVRVAAGMTVCEIPQLRSVGPRRESFHAGFIGKVEGQVVIVDDTLDTGGPLLSACEKLCQSGVSDISILVTHGLFAGTGGRSYRHSA